MASAPSRRGTCTADAARLADLGRRQQAVLFGVQPDIRMTLSVLVAEERHLVEEELGQVR